MTRTPDIRPLRIALLLGLGMSTIPACKMGKVTTPKGADKLWSQMDRDERSAHMYGVVKPRMETLFSELDGERFADFDCGTCHGDNAEEVDWALPNPALPKLNPKAFYKKHRKATPEMADFMWKVVEPEMAELLGVTHGPKGMMECGSCHLLEGE